MSLHPVSPVDAPLLHHWLSGETGSRYRHGLGELCPTPALLAERIALQRAIDPPIELEMLVRQRTSGEAIGLTALTAIDRFNNKAELSLALVHGRGTRCFLETLGFSIEGSFSWVKLHKLIFLVNADNLPVLRMMERYGAPHEGLFREELAASGGGRMDLHRFALLRREWFAHPLRARLITLFPHLTRLSD